MNTLGQTWESEREDLAHLYQDDRSERLVWAIGYARECRGQPLQIKRHLADWLTLLNHAHDRPDLHEAALELIGVLHQPIINLGRFVEWTSQVRFAIAVCARLGRAAEQAQFLERLSNILYWTGQFADAQTAAEESLAIARTIGDPRALVIGAKAIVNVLMTRAQIEAARALLESIETDPLVKAATGPTQAWIMAQLSLYHAMVRRAAGGPGALIEAAHLSDDAMAWLNRFPEVDPNLYAHVCRNQGVYHWQIDQYGRAIKLLRHAAQLFKQQNDSFDQRLVEGTLGLAYWSSGRLLKAERCIRRSGQAAKRLNARWQLARQTGNLALVALFRGRLLEARRYAERHCRLAEQLGVQMEFSRARCNRGIVAFHWGDYESALNDMDFDRRYLEQNYPNSEGLAPTYVNLARCYAATGNLGEARANVGKALRIADTTGLASLRVIALRAQAECSPDDHGPPIVALQEALNLAESIGRRMDAAGCLFSLANLTGDMQVWDTGVALLCRMNATGWLRSDGQALTIEHPPRLPAVT